METPPSSWRVSTLMEIIGLSLQVRLSAVLLGAISDCRWAQRWQSLA